MKQPETTEQPERTVDIVIPARNEEDCLGRCLASLTGQQGISFRITVIDDGSIDRTLQIAESFAHVRVIGAGEPPTGVMGKCNALITGAAGSTAKWLLFTDADTFHYPGSLKAAVREAEERRVDLLSYSPEQEVVSFAERAVMPLVFADLARTYPTDQVNDPQNPIVAANGQYILARREVYETLGGHQAIAGNILEDVELARMFKVTDHRIWFRYGDGIVRTRMYRSFHALSEGWTKNLAMLFPHPLVLAAAHLVRFLAIPTLLVVGAFMFRRNPQDAMVLLGLGVFFYVEHLEQVRQAHFPWRDNLLSFFGLPLFVLLLVRSYIHSRVRGAVTWKGRVYRQSAPGSPADSSTGGKQAKQKS